MKDTSLWNDGLKKTRKSFWGRIQNVLQKKDEETDLLLDDIEEILIESDVGVDTTMEILEDLQKVSSGQNRQDAIRDLLKEKMVGLIGESSSASDVQKTTPHVIMVVGVNGTGKTTTIGKLACHLKKEGKRVLLAAADTFRAAAGEQLQVWAQRAGAEIVMQPMGADPASVAYDALDKAIARNIDVLFIDTAGRLHTKINLMEELKKMHRVLGKRFEGAPHEILLVLDATTGQNGLQQAKQFAGAVGVTGLALTKLDGTARGGVVLSITKTLNLPILWAGLGEGENDLIPFDPEAFIASMLEETDLTPKE